MSQSVGAATTEYHRLGGLHTHVGTRVGGCEVSEYEQIWFLGRALFLAPTQLLSCCVLTWPREPAFYFYKDSPPIMGGSTLLVSFKPN